MRTVIILTAAAIVSLVQADARSILLEAKKLEAVGAAEEAITEYKRYIFVNPDSPAAAVYLSIADLYKDEEKLGNAQDALHAALSCVITDSIRSIIRIKYAVLDIAQGNYSSAQMELLRVASFSGSAVHRSRAALFLFISYALAGEWDEAEKTASDTSFAGNEHLRQLAVLLKSGNLHSRKSPAAARWMSTFVPGLGQIYAHDLLNGINALAISLLTAYMTVNSIAEGFYQEAVLTDITLFLRYYSGNRWNAVKAVERYNAGKDRAVKRLIFEKISSFDQYRDR
jgi:hypothetical protein